jgi:uncharacterized protein (TIGR02466 family)
MAELKARICWFTPIVEVINPAHASIKSDLVNLSHQLLDRDKGGIASGVAPGAKFGLYESPFNFFSNSHPAVQSLHEFCQTSLRNTLQMVDTQTSRGSHNISNAQLRLHESWVHITRDGGFHATHIHGNCSWCGIYYIDAGECGGDPPNGVNHFLPPFMSTYEDVGTSVMAIETITVVPQEGKLVLFPSFVRHSATVYRGTRERVLMAFNARVYPQGYKPGQ